MKFYSLIIALIFTILGCNVFNLAGENANRTKGLNEDTFLDTLQYRSFLYFIHETDLKTGLVKDRSVPESPASIAAMGFAIPVWAVGVRNNWITKKEAAKRTLNMLEFLYNSQQNASPDATGYKGFFYHFLDMKTGKRTWNSELSTIDTALLLGGIRFALFFFDGENGSEKRIRELAEFLTHRVDWNWTTSKYENEFKGSISLGWKPETGFDKIGWVGYNEALLLYIIVAGSGYKDSHSAYNKWLSTYRWEEPFEGLGHVTFPPLFGHQYSHIFINFNNLKDKYMRNKGIDYFENSRRAVLTQWKYAILNPKRWKGYDSLTWGLTACDGPGPEYNYDGKIFNWYSARGTSGLSNVMNDDGTIAPTASAASIVFEPDLVKKTVFNMYKKYGKYGLWGKYGFVDAFNPTLNWFDKDYLAIDQAPIVLMIQNYKDGFIWNYTMQDSLIQNGLKKLGFYKN